MLRVVSGAFYVTSALALSKMATLIRVPAIPEENRAVRAQLLPCSIRYRGPAPVRAFLRARPGPDGGERWGVATGPLGGLWGGY